MFRKRYFIWFTVLIYIVLFIILFVEFEEDEIYNSCYMNDVCVRFCCQNSKTCSDEFIRNNFNKSHLPTFEYNRGQNVTNLKIIYGTPSCVFSSSSEKWKINRYGGIDTDDGHHDKDYCFQDTTVNDEVKWNAFICNPGKKMKENFIIVPIAVIYVYLNKWKTLHGRIVMMFVSSLILECIFRQIVFYYYDDRKNTTMEFFIFIMIAASIVSILLWMSVMIFDIWLNFKNLNSTTDGMERFKFYCVYVVGIISIQIFIIFNFYVRYLSRWFENIIGFIVYGLFFIYLITFVLDLIFLIWTAIKIFKISTSSNQVAHSKYEDEKKRFWMCASAFGITLMIPFTNFFFHRNNELSIAISNCYIAFVFFVIFIVMEKNILQKLLHKYRIVHERMTNESSTIP
ncbi:CLUMA_CG008055, isoform A [Clunio marinus]|uniref:CLUMA_CG008055, isoform A n=1 Tax=Clunio marinus TaxID=568069 RepID=A0A1J1I822_9DIPT|nr:CLUMA_CG008055, isoform A [Clunio marinus]